MLCAVCKIDKLSSEFISNHLTKTCAHPKLICLRCAVDDNRTVDRCPYFKCDGILERLQIAECQTTLDRMFGKVLTILCAVCKIDKASNEFISNPLTKTCAHPKLICLWCAVDALSKSDRCPYLKCDGILELEQIAECKTTLDRTFGKVLTIEESASEEPEGSLPIVQPIMIVLLTGERIPIDYNADMSVMTLKETIEHHTTIDATKQKLIHAETELQDYLKNNRAALLKDYNIKPASSLYLMVLLYDIPTVSTDVAFDLSWETGDMESNLDAACIMFRGIDNVTVIRYDNREIDGNSEKLQLPWYKKMFTWTGKITTERKTIAIEHSGEYANVSRRGQKIFVHLDKIQNDVTRLFFTLSARDRPTIDHFENPSLTFYDFGNPEVNLCGTEFKHARNSQSVVICEVARNKTKNTWQIYRSGKLSKGNMIYVEPLIETLTQLIETGV